MRPVLAHSRRNMAVMTNPETTKNTSTPTKPPGSGMPAWKATTIRAATARNPWMSARRLAVPTGSASAREPPPEPDDDGGGLVPNAPRLTGVPVDRLSPLVILAPRRRHRRIQLEPHADHADREAHRRGPV